MFTMSQSDIGFAPSTLEVDYDKNLTDLYRAITDQDWEKAVEVCKNDPEQAKTWVVRHYDDEDEDEEEGEVMWRFLPLHSACARQPPISVVASLLRAYPDGAKCQDDQGMYSLHYACGNQATRDVVRILLVTFPDAAKKQDPRGMLPIHYLACWGPSSVSVVDMLLVANPNVATAKDSEGNSPLDLAREGDYPEKEAVVAVLQKWFASTSDASSQDSSARRRSSNRFTQSKDKATSSTPATKEVPSGTGAGTGTRQSRHRSSRRSPPKKTSSDQALMKKNRLSRSLEPTEAEEKKEDDDHHVVYTMTTSGTHSRHHSPVPMSKPMISDHEVKKLHDEIASLKSEKITLEVKLAEANLKNDLQEGELIELQEALSEAELHNTRGQEGHKDMTKELEKTRHKLKGCNEELKGLRITMVDMMEEHDELKRRESSMNDRLTSLSVSLDALMAQQKDLSKVLKSRSDQRRSAYQKRKENMRFLMEMEESNEEEDEALELKLKKQTKEMEALSAMIAAARD